MREKYDEKVVHFSEEISRLQKVILNKEELISSLQKNSSIKSPLSFSENNSISELERNLR